MEDAAFFGGIGGNNISAHILRVWRSIRSPHSTTSAAHCDAGANLRWRKRIEPERGRAERCCSGLAEATIALKRESKSKDKNAISVAIYEALTARDEACAQPSEAQCDVRSPRCALQVESVDLVGSMDRSVEKKL